MKQIIVITGEGCHSCKSLKNRLSQDNIEFVEVGMDSAEGRNFSKLYAIMSIPTTIIQSDDVLETIVGYGNKNYDKIRQFYNER